MGSFSLSRTFPSPARVGGLVPTRLQKLVAGQSIGDHGRDRRGSYLHFGPCSKSCPHFPSTLVAGEKTFCQMRKPSLRQGRSPALSHTAQKLHISDRNPGPEQRAESVCETQGESFSQHIWLGHLGACAGESKADSSVQP